MVMLIFSCSSEENIDEKDKIENISKNNSEEKRVKKDSLIEKKKEIFKYICPQGDKEGNSNIEGICASCGMELIENPDYQ